MLMEGGQVAGMRKHPFGRVDQLEDRYLGMVEAPSSNLGTSTRNKSKRVCWTCAKTVHLPVASVFGSERPPRIRISGANWTIEELQTIRTIAPSA